MTTNIQGSDPYEAVIADLLAKREQIDQTIALLTGLRGGAQAPINYGALPENGVTETAGMFLGMSIVDAAKKLLGMRKRTMGNSEIARELQAGGLVFSGKDPVNVVGSVLTRRFNDAGDVVKVGRGIWGLKEWYPGRNFKVVPSKAATMPALSADPEPDWADEETPMQPNPQEMAMPAVPPASQELGAVKGFRFGGVA